MSQVSQVLCEWGIEGARQLQAGADVFVIVDVLSFSTCVDMAVARNAEVIPFVWGSPEAARKEAVARNAEIAGPRGDSQYRYSLSPASLASVSAGTTVLLPSPNGSTISQLLQTSLCFAGCLRNAGAVAKAASGACIEGGTIAVIAAGERWPDGSIRVAIEDLLGTGAIIHALEYDLSAEAQIARQAFQAAGGDLSQLIYDSRSGQELCDRGFECDVLAATQLDVSTAAPFLDGGVYRQRL